MDFQIRDAALADLPSIVDIYNQSIPGAWSTADTHPIAVEDRLEWFHRHDPNRRPLWVAESEGRVIAWIGLTSFYAGRPAYNATAEVSLYIANDYQRRGLGLLLKRRMIEHCPRLGVTSLVSMHFDHNEATRRINQQLGFEQVGHLREIAVVNGQPRGLIISLLRIPHLTSVHSSQNSTSFIDGEVGTPIPHTPTKDEASIRQLQSDWFRATTLGDTATISNLMTDDVQFMTAGRSPFGKREFLESFEANLKKFSIVGEGIIEELQIVGDLAYARSQLTVTIGPRDGSPSKKLSGNALSIYSRCPDNHWRLSRDANMLTPVHS